ncbi:signal transducer and activator of transcription 2 [Megalops cyprinoides]|uniref:signal transducer and activator of transcription 2 n=1 Tax=Megalops cyprinoides TaxID=118141 RepID=UPI00186551A4|nr:signal transducer and activator of transcription 2 [Megalops cyprinoides]
MAQWEKLQCLDTLHLQKLDELYSREEFPMDVRHYLAPWIESQDWVRATQDPAVASVLFQVLLENMDNQHSRFVQEGESFLVQRNFRRFKQNFQRYQEQPCNLACVILWFLNKEREILQSAELAEQVQMLQVQPSTVETDNQRNIERKMAELKKKAQDMEHAVKSLEEQQDEFDFKYKTRMMEGNISEAERAEQTKILQYLLNRLDTSRKALLSEMDSLLDIAEELLTVLVREELVEWQRRQQKACIGAPENTCLNQLESWFTVEADCLFQLRKFLKKLEELSGKVTYERDPFKTRKSALQKRVDDLLTTLLKSSFVVETQPAMPQGKGPMVLRTNVQFSVRTRLLVKVPELNHAMKVTVSIDREAPQMKGYRRFNVLGNSSKALNMAESLSGGMVADFRHLTLKEQKAGGGGKGVNDLSLSVTEELHIINFETVFDLHGLSITLEACSLPVVIISNSSQQQSAWGSVLWFNMLCSDPKNIGFFASSPAATWPQLGEMLSWQFLSTTKRGLDNSQLEMIAQKLFGKQQSYDTCRIPWARFSKEMVPDTNFTFWAWFDGILVLVKNYLEGLWNDGLIMGFVSKGREKTLLKKKQMGTFLLRFSESIKDGGITFSWVEYFIDGKPNVRSVQPFTKVDLSQIPFSEIIRNFQILEAENVPENPLKFLYPSVPKDEAFGKYYTVKEGAQNPYLKYIKTKLVFVSKENTLEAKSPMNSLCDPEGTVPMNGLCDMHSDEASASDGGLPPSDALMSDLPDSDFLPFDTMGDMAPDPDALEPSLRIPDVLFNDPMMAGVLHSTDEHVSSADLTPFGLAFSTPLY